MLKILRRGLVAGGLALTALDAQALPVTSLMADAPASAQAIQYYYYEEDDAPVYREYRRAPRRYERYDYAPPERSYGSRRGYRPTPPDELRSRRYEEPEEQEHRESVRDNRRRERPRERTRPWSLDNGY